MNSLRQLPIPNTQRRVMWTAWIVTLACIGLAVLSGMYGRGDASYAGILLCGFGALVGIVTALVYLPRARAFQRLFHREPPLADWHYSAAEWSAYVCENYQRDRAGNWLLWLLIAGIALVVGFGMLIATQEPVVLWITLGLVVFLLIPAVAVPLNRRWRLRHNQARAVVSRHAIWIGGRFQTWTQLGAHLTSVEIDDTVSPRLLCITFRFYARTGPQDETVLVPVPAGEEAAVASVMAELRKGIRAGSGQRM